MASNTAGYSINNVHTLFAVTAVSAQWVDDSFTSLRVTLPEGGPYRIIYSAVNKSNTTEPMEVTTGSSSLVLKGFTHDCFYVIMVEAFTLDSSKTGNRSIGIGEQLLVSFFMLDLIVLNHNCSFCMFACRNWDCCCCCCCCCHHISTVRIMLLLAI